MKRLRATGSWVIGLRIAELRKRPHGHSAGADAEELRWPWLPLRLHRRDGSGALALAGGFAALARRHGVDVSLLDESWLAWKRLRTRLRWQRNNPGAGPGSVMSSQIDHTRLLSQNKEDTPEA